MPNRKAFVAVATLLLVSGCGPREPKNAGTPPVMRRLTQDQYKRIISDTFGPDIHIAGRLDPDVRKDGLLEVGAGEATVTPGSYEQYDSLARAIAAEVLDDKHRATFMACVPKSAAAPDPACAREMLAATGRLLFRRPLTGRELKDRLDLANATAGKLGNFYDGLEYALASLMVAPSFLFRKDAIEPDPDHKGTLRLNAYTKASRLSFLMWDAAPDDILLTAAEKGELNTEAGLARQVDRLLASPRIRDGVRAFFDDFLQLAQLESLDKDPTIYPKFSQTVAADAREQTLRTVTALLVADDGDYRDLFTTRKTFMSRALGVVYQVPVQPDLAWTPYEFPVDDPRAGILTQLSFTALYALPGRSSPTLRGKAIREVLLCETVPAAPVNVDFTSFEKTDDQVHKTARERLTAHRANPVCAGCHSFMDPMGLALENFDGLGAYRDTENGAAIDASGILDGVKFTTPTGLAQAMHDDPQTTACLVKRLFAYGTGRMPAAADNALMTFLEKKFADNGYKIRALLRQIALSDAFYRVAPPAEESNSASADNREKKS